jgi:hypothetical protein
VAPGRSTPTVIVVGLWLSVDAGAAVVGPAGTVVGIGVVDAELQALTLTMANAAITSVPNLRLGFAVISSLT